MPKKKTEISDIRSDRTKKIFELEKEKRSPEKFTQEMFAKLAHMSQQNLSSIINKKMALTEETAKSIVNAFPASGYRIEWLLGFDNDMTEADKFKRVIQETQTEADLLYSGVLAFLKLSGFQIDVAPIGGNGSLEETFQNMKEHCTITRDGKSVTFSLSELNAFENELCDYIEFRLLHMMK